MVRGLLSLAAALLLTSCAISERAPPCDDCVTLSIYPGTKTEIWRVVYELERPAERLHFLRAKIQPNVRANWQTSENVMLRATETGDVIEPVDGKPYQRFEITFPYDDRFLLKDYALHRGFTDGSATLYSGHFHVGSSLEARPPTDVIAHPRPGGRVIAGGQVTTEPAMATDRPGLGGYYYFGDIEPIRYRRFVGIVDPGLPRWVVDSLERELPKLFEYYENRIGHPLTLSPIVQANYVPKTGQGMSWNGGTLPENIHLSMEGEGWDLPEPDQDLFAGFFGFIAHEAAHLWNGEMFRNEDTGEDGWLHEGNADAFKFRALVELGVVGPEALLELHAQSLNECIRSLGSEALKLSASQGQYRRYYTCGASIDLLAERLQGRVGGDLFDFWRNLLEASKPSRTYRRASYFEALADLPESEAAIDFLTTLLDEGHPDPVRAWQSVLTAHGLTVAAMDETSPGYERALREDIGIAIQRTDCDGSNSFRTFADRLQLLPLPNCTTLSPEASFELVQVAGVGLDSAAAAYDAMAEACQRAQEVILVNSQGAELVLSCGAMAPRRPWLTLSETN